MFRFPKQEEQYGKWVKTLDVKTLDTFFYRNCTTMNYAPMIWNSHTSQTKKQ